MTDLTSLDLVERLKGPLPMQTDGPGAASPDVARIRAERTEAADEILRLRALIAPGEGCEPIMVDAVLASIDEMVGLRKERSPSIVQMRAWREAIASLARNVTRADARANEATAALAAEKERADDAVEAQAVAEARLDAATSRHACALKRAMLDYEIEVTRRRKAEAARVAAEDALREARAWIPPYRETVEVRNRIEAALSQLRSPTDG